MALRRRDGSIPPMGPIRMLAATRCRTAERSHLPRRARIMPATATGCCCWRPPAPVIETGGIVRRILTHAVGADFRCWHLFSSARTVLIMDGDAPALHDTAIGSLYRGKCMKVSPAAGFERHSVFDASDEMRLAST